MEAKPECYPCILSVLLKTARYVSEDEWLLRKVLDETMDILRNTDKSRTPPEIATEAFERTVRAIGEKDPYKSVRDSVNAAAKRMMEEARRMIDSAAVPFYTALKLAAVANRIDSLVEGGYTPDEVLRELSQAKFHTNDYDDLKDDIRGAKKLLYIFDNAGEIFFDKLLIERIKQEYESIEVVGVVRSEPVFNDATYEDAKAASIEDVAKLTDCGIVTVGTPLHSCSREFQQLFAEADVVIVKGQAGYETLESEVAPGRPFAKKLVYFLLTVKCDVVAAGLGLEVGTATLLKES